MSDSGQLILQINKNQKSEIIKVKRTDYLKIFLNKSISDSIKLKINDIEKLYKITGGSTITGTPLYKSVNTIGNLYIYKPNSKKKRVHSKIIDTDIKSISLIQINENTANI